MIRGARQSRFRHVAESNESNPSIRAAPGVRENRTHTTSLNAGFLPVLRSSGPSWYLCFCTSLKTRSHWFRIQILNLVKVPESPALEIPLRAQDGDDKVGQADTDTGLEHYATRRHQERRGLQENTMIRTSLNL
ncbi:hypothetical protein Q5P01_024121 [Channa striata]|uniref:Uncharacterized protein n=1 Tax=Channa striata TaxID=64152 RepID=A0AA88LJ85_CHASR|nr:hypothetical protein Q5P01_024121 [Channa striata]